MLGNSSESGRIPVGSFLPQIGRLVFGVLLALSISVLALLAVVRRQPDAGWRQAIGGARPQFLLLCVALLVVSWVCDAMRLRALGIGLGHRLRLRTLVATIMMGNFLTLSTPFMVGGAPALMYVIHRQGPAPGQATAMVVLGGVAAQIALAGFNLMAATVLAGQLPDGAWLGRAYFGFAVSYFVGLCLFLVAALNFGRLRPYIESFVARRDPRGLVSRLLRLILSLMSDFRASLVQLTGRGIRHFAAAVGWAAGYFLLYFSVGLAVLLALGVAGHVPTLFAWQVVAATIALFSPSPGGSGAAEFGAMFAFGEVLTGPALPAFVVLWRFFTFYVNLILGALATAWLARRLARQGGALDVDGG